MENVNDIKTIEKPETQTDIRLDKLEKFFPEEKMERAKARLAKAKNFPGKEQEESLDIPS